jgi:putative transcriptional regulator
MRDVYGQRRFGSMSYSSGRRPQPKLTDKPASTDTEALADGSGKDQISQMASSPPDTDDVSPEGFLTGQLLIAMPAMADQRFQQSVIYMCAHTPEGAMGLVLNRPIVKPTFDDLLKQLNVEPLPPVRQISLCAGGPVENARGFVLHTSDWTGEGSLKVDDNMALTASLDVLKVIAEGRGPRECVLALGYAGWGPGQLDQEIQQNAWLSVQADETLLFDGEHDTKWRRAFAKLRVDPLLLSDTAGHA